MTLISSFPAPLNYLCIIFYNIPPNWHTSSLGFIEHVHTFVQALPYTN